MLTPDDPRGELRCAFHRPACRHLPYFSWHCCRILRPRRTVEDYDTAVATHAADFYQQSGGVVVSGEFRAATQAAAAHVQEGFHKYVEAWRETQMTGSE